MRIRASSGWRGRLATLAALPAAGVVLAACGERANTNATSDASWPTLLGESGERIGFPHQVVTSEGIAAAGLYLPILLIAFVIFILIEGLLLYMVWRFRRRSKDGELPEQVHGNNRLEIIWTAIPLVVVAVLFAGSVVVLNDVESKTEDPDVVVHAMAQQFGWTFTYQDFDPATGAYADTGIVAYGRTAPPSTSDPSPPGLEMVLPIDRSIRFRIEARDVIHSFYVPAFFFKRDAIPGRVNEFEVTIEEPGVYGGQCAEFCGLLHGQMFFSIRAVEGSEYDAWVAGGGQPLTAEASDAGDAQSDPGTSDTTSEEAA